MKMSALASNDFVTIATEPLDQLKITNLVSDPSAGAISIFIGTTRDYFEGKQVVRLHYEAYTSMALKQLQQVCASARQQWPLCKIAIAHRIGTVPVGEASVIIAASSEHRQAAMEAVTYAITSVKESATIWKKEEYSDGAKDWKVNKECHWTNESTCSE